MTNHLMGWIPLALAAAGVGLWLGQGLNGLLQMCDRSARHPGRGFPGLLAIPCRDCPPFAGRCERLRGTRACPGTTT